MAIAVRGKHTDTPQRFSPEVYQHMNSGCQKKKKGVPVIREPTAKIRSWAAWVAVQSYNWVGPAAQFLPHLCQTDTTHLGKYFKNSTASARNATQTSLSNTKRKTVPHRGRCWDSKPASSLTLLCKRMPSAKMGSPSGCNMAPINSPAVERWGFLPKTLY